MCPPSMQDKDAGKILTHIKRNKSFFMTVTWGKSKKQYQAKDWAPTKVRKEMAKRTAEENPQIE